MKVSHKQEGLALLVLVFLLALLAIGYGINALDSSGLDNERNKKTAIALAEGKAALLGSVIGVADVILEPINPNYYYYLLPNPDSAASLHEGVQSGTLGIQDGIIIGKLPWKDLNIQPIKDGWGECLWYVISGRYKNSLRPTNGSALPFNWDREGQIDVIDANGNTLATNLVALVVSPGPILNGQDRSSNPSNKNCGGNYDVRNYLDTYTMTNASSGEVNYFSGTTDNRQATNTNNKTFVLANNVFYNDQFAFITVDDIFDSLVKRRDFVIEINAQLDNAQDDIANYSVPVSGDKGTDSINCNPSGITLKTDRVFCENWREMFLMKENASVDGTNCSKVFIFAGKKTGAQVRLSEDDKKEPANYLEEPNLSAFNVTGNFSGSSTFDGNNPSADVLKCI